MNIDKMNKIQNEELETFFSEYEAFIEQIEEEKKAEEKRLFGTLITNPRLNVCKWVEEYFNSPSVQRVCLMNAV